MIANNNVISPIHNYNFDFVQGLQNQVDNMLAAKINRQRTSEKNDLGICFNKENYWELGVYSRILKQISYCNSCFKDEDIEDITGIIKNNING